MPIKEVVLVGVAIDPQRYQPHFVPISGVLESRVDTFFIAWRKEAIALGLVPQHMEVRSADGTSYIQA